MPADPDPDHAFVRVLTEGTDEAINAWIAEGPRSVARLRHELSGKHRAAVPEGTAERELLDNLMWASHEVAAALPDEFLEAFHNEKWDENPFVCSGLGAIRRPEVTERLIGILKTQNHWLRMSAAVALRGHSHPELHAALIDAQEDPDDLVRYHVEERLAELEDPSR